ncbi:MAG TPA: response regulator transcription factor [Mycobacteriales bacterium]|nr:response regulator transcription factor [Mycobacteriales bacterium]
MSIRVLLVDDEELVRTGLQLILEGQSDIVVVGTADDGDAAIAQTLALAPDVVLMDIRMKRTSGLDAARRILAQRPQIRIVILTTFDHDEYVYDALRIGVSGFLLKDAPRDELIAAVRAASRGDALLAPGVTRRLIAEFAGRDDRRRKHRIELLTPRELEVMGLVAQGLSNAEIAKVLVVGEKTVKTHISNVLMKLELRDRTQIAVAAYESGVARA